MTAQAHLWRNREMGPRFVGRQHTIEELLGCLDGATRGRGSLVLLHGEPGIGKTRLAIEVAGRAEALGARVAWGRCWPGEGAPGFWPWVQVLRALALDSEAARLLPPGGARPPGDGGDTRFMLFDGIGAALRAASVECPSLLVLDDLQWADVPSLLLLAFVARSLTGARLLVVGTFRDVDAGAAPEVLRLLTGIAREGRAIPLLGLSRADLGELATSADETLLARLHDATGGNPFFAEGVLRLLADEPPHGAALPVPVGVRAAIRQRTERVPAPTRSLLGAASVLGRAFDADLLADVAELADVEPFLTAATSAGLLHALPDRRFAFAHDLVRETVYADLPVQQRRHLHARASDALERRTQSASLSEVAHHALAALPLGDPRRAADLAARAGRLAASQCAFEPAVTLLERALDVGSRLPDMDPAELVDLLLDVAGAQTDAGQVRAAQQTCRRAAERAGDLGDADRLARAALGYGAEVAFGVVDPYHVALLEQAIAALDTAAVTGRAPLRALLLARLGAAMQPSATPERPIVLAREAVAAARTLGNPATLARVLATGRAAWRSLDDLGERLAMDTETARLAAELGDHRLAAQAHRRLVLDGLEGGDMALVDEHTEAFERASEAAPRAESAALRIQLRAARAALTGRFSDASELNDAAETAFRRVRETLGVATLLAPFRMQRLLLERAWGRRARLAELLAEPWGALDPLIRGDVLAQLGQDGAREHYERAAGLALPGNLHLLARLLLAETCVRLRDVGRAARLRELLLPLAGRNVVWASLLAACDGAASRLIGELSTLLGDWALAAQHLDDAERMNQRIGAPPWVARTRLAKARMLEARGWIEDRAEAARLRDQAADCFAALGMETFLDEAGAPRPRGPRPQTPGLRRSGSHWMLTHGETTHTLDDSDGLRYLDHLLSHPGVDVHAAELQALGRGASGRGVSAPGPILDAQAKAAYGRRLTDLRDTLEEATRFGDQGRAARAEEEIEALAAELSRAVGLGGRDRATGSSAERARVNVTLRIRHALKTIRAVSPAATHDLEACIRTGTFCCYTPAPGRATS
ncbi:MAG: hypothetical protein AMXMBFR64_56790 [Myxococcales bacterium]